MATPAQVTPATAIASNPAPQHTRRRSIEKPSTATGLSYRSQWQQTAPWTRVQLLGAAILVVGSASFLLEGVIFHSVRQTVQITALAPSEGLLHSVPIPIQSREAENVIEATTATVLSVMTPAPVSAPETPLPTPPPPQQTFASRRDYECYYQRDLGLISEIRDSQRVFCQAQGSDTFDETRRTQVSFIDLAPRGNIDFRAMIFDRNFGLDFTTTTIARPIASIAQDGGGHDPRFTWSPSLISCGCRDFQQFASAFYRASGNRTILRPWDPTLASTDETIEEPSTVCGTATTQLEKLPPPASAPAPMRVITDKTILITRRDDHNPFFQISSALNAWLMAKTLGWRRDETRVIFMDGGFPSPIDDLHYRLLSTPSNFSLLRGSEHLLGHKFQFTNQVLIAPYETTGPLMQHLNDEELCQHSQLITNFRAAALAAMAVSPSQKDSIIVTIISRRNYGGRRVQRRWRNEHDVVAAMQAKYPRHDGKPIVIQSIDFVDLTLQQQMEISLASDVVIGMHGAGMVNVLWTKPKTLVVEIFPRMRYRWGYRNICRYIGCDWHEFRGGQDTGRGDNASDKTIPVDEWLAFFDPLFRQQIGMATPPSLEVGKSPMPTPATTGIDRRGLRWGYAKPSIHK